MKLTFERSVAIIVIGCAVITAAFMPVDRGTAQQENAEALRRAPGHMWAQRMQARSSNLSHVLGEYRTQRAMIAAKQAFGSRPGNVGEPEVSFSNDIPEAYRASFNLTLAAERNERGEWKGHGKVGVMVFLDTMTSVDGHPITWLQSHTNGRVTKLRVIPPSAATGDRCVVSIEIPSTSRSLSNDGDIAKHVQPLLDACAFYDAFGAPGAEIARELSDARMEFARGYLPASSDSVKYRPGLWYWPGMLNVDMMPARCLAGDDNACIAQLSESPWRWAPYLNDAPSAAAPGISSTQARIDLSYRYSTLNKMARELGPQRFLRVWQSPKSLAAAYFDETGETLVQLIRRKERAEYGAYHSGPWVSPLNSGLTLLTIAGLLWLAVQCAPRPRVA